MSDSLFDKFDIRTSVRNPHDEELHDTYNIVNTLVQKAGHITIGQLFTASMETVGAEAWNAIRDAKEIGFLAFNNKSCCVDGKCEKSDEGWCSEAEFGCSMPSDHCRDKGARST